VDISALINVSLVPATRRAGLSEDSLRLLRGIERTIAATGFWITPRGIYASEPKMSLRVAMHRFRQELQMLPFGSQFGSHFNVQKIETGRNSW
jgi:hypothetical protein